jgi:hypothetical protein
MAMELLSFHNQLVSNFLAHDKNDDLFPFHILQDTQVTCAQLELGQRIGAQSFDRFCRCRRLVFKAGQNGRFHDALVTTGTACPRPP